MAVTWDQRLALSVAFIAASTMVGGDADAGNSKVRNTRQAHKPAITQKAAKPALKPKLPPSALSLFERSSSGSSCMVSFVTDLNDNNKTIYGEQDADRLVLPASVAKIVAGLIIDDLVKKEQITWETPIDVTVPLTNVRKKQTDMTKVDLWPTKCSKDTRNIQKVKMPLREAVGHMLKSSIIYGAWAIQDTIETLTGKSYATVASEMLATLNNTKSHVIEAVGISNGAKCTPMRGKTPADFAAYVEQNDIARQMQNTTTPRDVSLWLEALNNAPKLLDIMREKTGTILKRAYTSTNPFLKAEVAAAEGKASKYAPFEDCEIILKTGFTTPSGISGAALARCYNGVRLTVSTFGCDSEATRYQVTRRLAEEWMGQARTEPPAPAASAVAVSSAASAASSAEGRAQQTALANTP